MKDNIIVSVSFLFIAVIFWRLWSKKFREPAEITKISIGSFIAVTGMLSLAMGAAIAAASGGKVAIGSLIGFHILNSAGFANVFPVFLAFYARVAPAALSATIIGIYYLTFFAANNLVGWIGGLLEKCRPRNFGSYMPHLPVSQLPFFSRAEFSDTCSRLVMIRPRKIRTPLC